MSTRRLIGCPGGGKTHKLEELAQRAAGRFGASNVLAVSLTRTAAAEIRKRETEIPAQNCATLHAQALRALEIKHDEVAETPASMREFNASHEALVANNANDQQWAGEEADEPRGQASAIHVAVTNHRARMTPDFAWTDDERTYHAAWQAYCERTGRYDFTTMIERCITENVAPLGDPRVILADEAQDFTRLEFGLLLAWARHTDSTVMVGDSEQCIFYFRGADPDALEAIPIARSESLDQSYRVPRAIHAAASAWVSQLPGPDVQWQPRDTDGSVDLAPYALCDTSDVLDAINASGHDTVMVLASCRYMLSPLVTALKANGVPFANRWAESEPMWNPLQGASTRALLALLRPRRDAWDERARMWTWADLLTLTDPMQATALGRGAKAAIKAHCIPDQFSEDHADDEVPVATLMTLLGESVAGQLLDIDHRMDATIDWWQGALKAKATAGVRYPLAVLAAHGAGALRAEPKLTIGTIHSTKGSEADAVLLAPELSKQGYYEGWLGGGPGRDAIIRQFYVGCTRARESLTILEPACPEYAPVGDMLRDLRRAA